MSNLNESFDEGKLGVPERRKTNRRGAPTKALVIRTIEIDGQSIRTLVRPGSSHLTPLLVFNGIGASLELVIPFMEALDREQEVIAFDVPGVGGSSTPVLPYGFSGLARLVAQMLDYLDYGQVNVIGVSWGGFLAQQFAFDHPLRCKKLILAATSCGVFMVPPSLKVLWLMSSPLRYTSPAYGAKIAPYIYGGVFRSDKALAAAYAEKMQSSGGRGYYYQMMAVYMWTSIHWVHKIRQPTLVLAGNDDPLIPLVNMRRMAQRMPNADLHVINDGHLFLVTQAKTVGPLVTRFLTEERNPTVVNQ
jgi:poly(3-hydroxyalkanoate) depolymerase